MNCIIYRLEVIWTIKRYWNIGLKNYSLIIILMINLSLRQKRESSIISGVRIILLRWWLIIMCFRIWIIRRLRLINLVWILGIRWWRIRGNLLRFILIMNLHQFQYFIILGSIPLYIFWSIFFIFWFIYFLLSYWNLFITLLFYIHMKRLEVFFNIDNYSILNQLGTGYSSK